MKDEVTSILSAVEQGDPTGSGTTSSADLR